MALVNVISAIKAILDADPIVTYPVLEGEQASFAGTSVIVVAPEATTEKSRGVGNVTGSFDESHGVALRVMTQWVDSVAAFQSWLAQVEAVKDVIRGNRNLTSSGTATCRVCVIQRTTYGFTTPKGVDIIYRLAEVTLRVDMAV